MRIILTVSVATATIALSAAAASAGQPIFTPAPVAQEYYYPEVFPPACPYRYEPVCWRDGGGVAHCTCKPGLGFYLFRFFSG
jgi:hypothetical protein